MLLTIVTASSQEPSKNSAQCRIGLKLQSLNCGVFAFITHEPAIAAEGDVRWG